MLYLFQIWESSPTPCCLFECRLKQSKPRKACMEKLINSHKPLGKQSDMLHAGWKTLSATHSKFWCPFAQERSQARPRATALARLHGNTRPRKSFLSRVYICDELKTCTTIQGCVCGWHKGRRRLAHLALVKQHETTAKLAMFQEQR